MLIFLLALLTTHPPCEVIFHLQGGTRPWNMRMAFETNAMLTLGSIIGLGQWKSFLIGKVHLFPKFIITTLIIPISEGELTMREGNYNKYDI